MKLLMTADTLGGVWTYAMELCRALGPTGWSIALATMGRALSIEQRRQVDGLAHVELYESTYRLCWMEEPWDDVEQAGDWLLSIAAAYKPDIVHLNDLAHGALPWRAPVLLVGHSCVLSWWEAVKRCSAPELQWHRYRRVVRQSLQRADMVVAPSSAMLSALQRYYGPFRRAKVIYNGRDFPAPVSVGTAGDREELIFAAGRLWDEAKNIRLLTDLSQSLSWPVYIAGERHDRQLGGKVMEDGVYVGFLRPHELAGWLARSAIYVAPAYYEPFGLSILEAARSGCALVLGDIASLREIWGEAACFVDPDSSASLQHGLTRLIEDNEKRLLLADRAAKRARCFHASRMAADYHACYRLLENNTVPATFGNRGLCL